jgi:hypothetical protein
MLSYLIKTITTRGACALDVPLSVAERVETKFVRDLSNAHGVGQVLFVAEHEEHCVAELILVEHLLELLIGFVDTLPIVGVDHEDQTLCVLEIVAPQGSDL